MEQTRQLFFLRGSPDGCQCRESSGRGPVISCPCGGRPSEDTCVLVQQTGRGCSSVLARACYTRMRLMNVSLTSAPGEVSLSGLIPELLSSKKRASQHVSLHPGNGEIHPASLE